MKQTAVEFIEESINDLSMSISDGYKLIKILKQAKKMEKEQLCYFYIKGAEAELNNPYVTNIEYYNQTFKSE